MGYVLAILVEGDVYLWERPSFNITICLKNDCEGLVTYNGLNKELKKYYALRNFMVFKYSY